MVFGHGSDIEPKARKAAPLWVGHVLVGTLELIGGVLAMVFLVGGLVAALMSPAWLVPLVDMVWPF